ncbi:MAG: prepilin peptidase [Deltaproteobacteria bacterium]|nr:prepilin peptidase [Deltaproteobacteria bacterium]
MTIHPGYLISFLFGAIIGSFLNVAILRIPEPDQSVVYPASHCPECKTPLKWYDNIPLFSFIFLRRKCRYCKCPISWQYPLVELSMGLFSLALFHFFPFPWPFVGFFLFTAALLVIIVIDFRHQIIPDIISLPGILAGFACSFLNPAISWTDSGLGIFLGGGILFIISYGYYFFTKRVGMGGGDIKLLAMIGAFLGYQSLPFVIFSSAFLGSLAGLAAMIKQKKGGQTVIPYGPFLAAGALLYLFFETYIQFFMRSLLLTG